MELFFVVREAGSPGWVPWPSGGSGPLHCLPEPSLCPLPPSAGKLHFARPLLLSGLASAGRFSWLQGVCLLRVPVFLLHNCIPETCTLILLLSQDLPLFHLFLHLCIIRHLLNVTSGGAGFTDSHPPQKDARRKPLGSDSLSVSG